MCEKTMNLQEICRICEETKFLIDITLPENQHLYQKLGEIEGIENHPNYKEFHKVYKFICSACENNLEGVYEFRTQCINTRKKLSATLKQEELIEVDCGMEVDDEPSCSTDPLSPGIPVNSLSQTLPIDPLDIKEEEDNDQTDQTFNDYQAGNYEEEEHREFIEIVESHHIYENAEPLQPVPPTAKKFQCQNCEKSFNKKMSFDRHRITHHLDKNVCLVCEMRFSTRRFLIRHILFVHENIRKQYCQKCNKLFASKELLKAHMENHGIQKFSCPICIAPVPFIRLGMLEDHIKVHRAQGVDVKEKIIKLAHKGQMEFIPENQRRKMCDKCGELYVNHKSYRRKNREEITCAVCLEKFKNLDDLSTHLDVHLKDKPFTCDLCNKAFKWKPKLVSHRLTHTGSKQFKCGYCEYGFTRSFELTNHLKLCHVDQIQSNEDDSVEEIEKIAVVEVQDSED